MDRAAVPEIVRWPCVVRPRAQIPPVKGICGDNWELSSERAPAWAFCRLPRPVWVAGGFLSALETWAIRFPGSRWHEGAECLRPMGLDDHLEGDRRHGGSMESWEQGLELHRQRQLYESQPVLDFPAILKMNPPDGNRNHFGGDLWSRALLREPSGEIVLQFVP